MIFILKLSIPIKIGRDDRPKVTTICIDGYKFVLVGDTLKRMIFLIHTLPTQEV